MEFKSRIKCNGQVSLMQIKRLIFWLDNGTKYYCINGNRVCKKEKEYILNHFAIQYSKERHRYFASEDNVYEVLRSDYPDKFKQFDITDYTKLSYLAL